MADPIKIECLADVIEHASRASYSQAGLRFIFWWRGQGADRPDWVLTPKIYRNSYDYDTEFLITERFRMYAPSRYGNCPGEKAHSAWLCLMQHHGVASRLLDWTESVLVAIHFAAAPEKCRQEPGVLWALRPAVLNGCQGLERWIPIGDSETPRELPLLFERPFNRSGADPQKILAFLPNQIDPRHLAQHAAFTIHGCEAPIEQLSDNDQYLTKYTIPVSSKPRILAELDLCGINESTLFPDLDHLAAYCSSLRMAPPSDKTSALLDQDADP